jgi:hypothetical protein
VILAILQALADPDAFAIRVDRQTGEIHIERKDVLRSQGIPIRGDRA